ncbi:MAG: cyclodeaminase/cyclohydrolase family protein, partial [Microbacterium sp.]
ALVAAFRLPTDTPGREARIRRACLEAAASSADLVAIAGALREPLGWLAREGEQRLAPDVAVAARLLAAGIRAAAVNIRCDTTAAAAAGASADELRRLRDSEAHSDDLAGELEALAGEVAQAL